MKVSKILILLSVAIILLIGCDRISNIKGSIAGTVYREGRPIMGQIQVIDPRTGNSIITEPVGNSGHFIIQNVPPGDYFLSVLGPTAAPLGEYMYVRVQPGRPITGLNFEILNKDPKVEEFLKKLEEERGGTPTE